MKNDFNTPPNLIDLKKKLTIKEIKYILDNLSQTSSEYYSGRKLMESLGCKKYKYIDYESVDALQVLFKYCQNKPLLCKLAAVFNRYVKGSEMVWLYEPYSGEDKLYSCGYDVEPKFPKTIKEKIISLSQKTLEKREKQLAEERWYY